MTGTEQAIMDLTCAAGWIAAIGITAWLYPGHLARKNTRRRRP